MYRYFNELPEVLIALGLLILGCVLYYGVIVLAFLNWQKRLTMRFVRDGVLKKTDPVYGSANRLNKPDAYIAYSDFHRHFIFWCIRSGVAVVSTEHISKVRFFVERSGEEEELAWREGEIYEKVGETWESKSVLGIPVTMSIKYDSEDQFEISIHRLEDLRDWAGRVENSILR